VASVGTLEGVDPALTDAVVGTADPADALAVAPVEPLPPTGGSVAAGVGDAVHGGTVPLLPRLYCDGLALPLALPLPATDVPADAVGGTLGKAELGPLGVLDDHGAGLVEADVPAGALPVMDGDGAALLPAGAELVEEGEVVAGAPLLD
jgi:hypothetical protein